MNLQQLYLPWLRWQYSLSPGGRLYSMLLASMLRRDSAILFTVRAGDQPPLCPSAQAG